jgi:hypothetical protein
MLSEQKIRSRKQRTDLGKYSFVNRTILRWSQLPADGLGTVKQAVLGKGLGKR